MYLPYELAKNTSEAAEFKVNRKFLKVLVSSMLAGLFIGLGYFGYIVITANSGIDLGLSKFIGGLVFSVGIVMVIIAGADLFTGNCLVMFGVVTKKVKFSSVVTHLLVVLLGNFIGALFLVFLVYYSNTPGQLDIIVINRIADAKMNLSFSEAIFRGILCNILVAIGVYMSYAAKNVTGKILGAVFPVMVFVILGFEHSVANMFILPLSGMYQSVPIMGMLLNNLVPAILGNFIGGGIILPFAYYLIYLKE